MFAASSSYLQRRAACERDLRFTFRRYPESHGAVPLHSVYDGLLSIFDGWEIENPFGVYEQGGLGAIEKHFADLSGATDLRWPFRTTRCSRRSGSSSIASACPRRSK